MSVTIDRFSMVLKYLGNGIVTDFYLYCDLKLRCG